MTQPRGIRALRGAGTRTAPARLAIIVVVAVTAAVSATGGSGRASAAPRPGAAALQVRNASTPIQHVVIMFQENHSFDNVLGALCAARTRATPCDGATTGVLPGGALLPLSRSPDIVPQGNHSVADQVLAVDGGRMDGFGRLAWCGPPARTCYTQYQPDQIPNLAGLAGQFAVSDRTFELGPVSSWGSHLSLVTQTTDGFTGDNPVLNSAQPSPPVRGRGWGCDSNLDAPWTAPGTTTPQLQPSCVPDPLLDPTLHPNGGAYRPTPVQHVPTIMDELDAAQLSWHFYSGNYPWSICPTFADCLYTGKLANVVSPTRFLSDAKAGTLPSFSILLPWSSGGSTSQHNLYSMAVGDNWIGQAVTALEQSPEWRSTALFITYDDCGCFYDHVPPPAALGIRVPMVIVSPFARPGFTDSNAASFASLLAYTEHTLGLPPLGSSDATAYDYSAAFNYAQAPLAGVAMTQQTISAAELQELAANQPDAGDPT